MFPTLTTPLDDFNRANEGPPPSASWTNVAGGMTVNTNQLACNTSSGSARWVGSSFGADQEAWMTVATKPGAAKYFGLLLRYNVSTNNGYQCYCIDQSGTDAWEIWKVVSGVFTQLGSTTTGPELSAGDKIGADVVADKLSLYRFNGTSWSMTMTVNDSTFTGAGHIGVYAEGTTGRYDNFGGGTIVPSLPPTPERRVRRNALLRM